MADRDQITGGFVGLNEGKIKDSYCYFIPNYFRKQKVTFSGENSGEIYTSFANCKGSLTDQYNSRGMGVSREIQGRKDAIALGFDTDNIWKYTGDRHVLMFRDDKWNVKMPAADGKKTFVIRSIDDFFKFSELVNSGRQNYADAFIRLACDLDLKNKEIEPIGKTRKLAFAGVFDGGEHIIKNFRIKGSMIGSYGLFGYLKGTVINLTLDCEVSGEGNVGAICGINDGSIICSGAFVNIHGSGDRLRMGGLCGENQGEVDRCYVAIRMHVAVVPIIPIGIAASMLVAVGTIMFMAIPAAEAVNQTYAPIDSDTNQIRIDDEEAPENMGANMLSFRFNETLHVDANTGNVVLDFKNPSYATTKLVVTLEADNGDGSRTVMAESGAVEPGYGLYYLTLNDAGYDLINSGVREAYIVLTPYSTSDDDKSMVDTTLPVTITIDR